eukprot:2869162-Pyramimonas_sp.AAC.1
MRQETGQITADSAPMLRMHGLRWSPCAQRATAPPCAREPPCSFQGRGEPNNKAGGSAALRRTARL